MYIFLTVLLALIALGWLHLSVQAARGIARMPRLKEAEPLPASECPSVSVLVAARDEAEKLPGALESWLALDCPRLEVIAVNDRSQDRTGEILHQFAARHTNLKVVHVGELPPGWLGKSHALTRAYEASTGEWLLLTDADVQMAPEVLRRALRLAQDKGWDHLAAFARLEMEGFWEKTALTYFGLGFVLSQKPWETSNPRSKRYVGVGAFQLIRRSTYEAVGTHRRLAMEVVEDMKLGKLVKEGGFRSGAANAQDHLRLRWTSGVGNHIRGLTKNTFAVYGYSTGVAVANLAGMVLSGILPFAALLFASGLPQLFAGLAVLIILATHGAAARYNQVSALYGLTHPLGAALTCYVVLRSVAVTLWRGGILWRDTFYPLDELRKGQV